MSKHSSATTTGTTGRSNTIYDYMDEQDHNEWGGPNQIRSEFRHAPPPPAPPPTFRMHQKEKKNSINDNDDTPVTAAQRPPINLPVHHHHHHHPELSFLTTTTTNEQVTIGAAADGHLVAFCSFLNWIVGWRLGRFRNKLTSTSMARVITPSPQMCHFPPAAILRSIGGHAYTSTKQIISRFIISVHPICAELLFTELNLQRSNFLPTTEDLPLPS